MTDIQPRPERVVTGPLTDPLVRGLVYASGALLIVWLIVVLFAFVIGPPAPEAPRTAAERALLVYEAQVLAGDADVTVWASYIRALIDAQQLSRAKDAIDIALESATQRRSLILAERARLSLAMGEHRTAVDQADEAIREATAEMEATQREQAERASTSATAEPPASYASALLIKAEALAVAGDAEAAIAAYSTFLERWPTAADVLVARGDLRRDSGDLAGAESDYRAALQFGPDYQPALDGLESIGVAR